MSYSRLRRLPRSVAINWHLGLALAAAIAVSTVSVSGDAPPLPRGQTSSASQKTGRIVGIVKPRPPVWYGIFLSGPGMGKPGPEELTDGHGKFVLEGVQPGEYVLNVDTFQQCGVPSTSIAITVHAGETLHMKIKLKVARNARCE
jgi:hypothetical protein